MEGDRTMTATESPERLKLSSKRYGDLWVEPEQIYDFPHGLVGLHELKRFALVPFEGSPFYLLHAFEGDWSFLTVPTELISTVYEFQLDEATAQSLDITDMNDVAVLLIVNWTEERPFVNLKAPLLLNTVNRKGCQYIIQDRDYPIRHPLTFKETA